MLATREILRPPRGRPGAEGAPTSMHRRAAWRTAGRTAPLVGLALLAACGGGQVPQGPAPAAAGARATAVAPVYHRPADARMEALVDSLLRQMTLEEKLGQLTQFRGRWGLTGPQTPEGGQEQVRAGEVGSFLGIHGAQETREMQEAALQSRLRIPLLFAHDVIHGFRTIFPVPLAEAASFDPAAAALSARVAAVEASAAGLHWTFAPMVDVARDPRWGRVVEGAGEDPYLGSVLAAARVRGFQGSDLRAHNTIAATAKHFAAYGGAEGGRDYNVVELGEQTLRDVYLPPFQAAVCAGAETFMASFNEINGVPAHADRWLQTELLRGEWGFPGLVVSDYTGVKELIQHGVAADNAEAGRLALEAGVDIDMVSDIYLRDLPAEVRAGRLSQAVVDTAVKRVLRLKYRLGLFEDPYRYSDAERERAETLKPAHRAAAREVARRSMVLLQNERNTLPLRRDLRTLAVIGALASDGRSAIGNWAAAGRAEDAITVLDGIRGAAAPGTRVLYAKGAGVTEADTSGFAEAARVAREADAVVLVLGEREDMSAEASNRASIGLPGVQEALVRRVVAAAGGKPVAAVLMNGRPLALSGLVEQVPAVLEAWFLGVEMGPAVAEVLFGEVNPSGKLPITFPRVTGQVPIYYNHKNTGRPPSETDRYTSKYQDVHWTPLFAFGHGLSYTTFAHGAPRLSTATLAAGDTLTVEVEVRNTGARAGDEVVQLYLRDEVARLTRPVQELKGFERVSLQPGEAKTVRFRLTAQELAYWGPGGVRVAEPGHFTVMTGGSSQAVQRARFQLTTPGNRPLPVPASCAAMP